MTDNDLVDLFNSHSISGRDPNFLLKVRVKMRQELFQSMLAVTLISLAIAISMYAFLILGEVFGIIFSETGVPFTV